jgi:hypothetical protein
MANFTAAQAQALFDSLKSAAQGLALFQGVDTHEPLNAPGNRLYCSIVLGPMRPVTSSGLAAVSGQITFDFHVWSSAMQKPYDAIDPEVLAVTASLMGVLSGELTLGGTVRNVELFSMTAQPGYLEFEGKQFRTMALTVPVVINDMWTEVA